MYSLSMPVVTFSPYGTGRAGSLTYSSNPSPSPPPPPAAGEGRVGGGGSNASRPPARKYSGVGRASAGGQAGYRRHRFVPVSNTVAFASRGSPLPFRWYSKNG